MEILKKVEQALYQVIDPELNVNIMDLGLVYNLKVKENNDVYIKMTLTTPGCPLHDTIVGGAEKVVEAIDGVNDVQIDLVWLPQWSPDKMSKKAKEMLMS
ncbi:metal-sulfur cluster biosynthetic enzyme [Salirhabdus euzebyi]|uniref:Metal-sulfur cluster biosynthetic enzyme n=1 Tax=Salirhabdus euzebyi TaxID=394506 RepID=A0A841Q3X2_9BACI|nr:metal-sulfur cluster assembly factor [Salirhabdus euzebyi]MBB6453087.1 metal-sulfur cluster biosynthetic enzyme [Salirhabdus euzebyi]